MASIPAHRPLTHHDLEETPEDGNRYEVIDGALFVSPFPTYPHQRAQSVLHVALANHARAHSLGEVFGSGLKVVLDLATGVGPDLVFVTTARMVDMREDGFHGVPDLIVEVVSSRPGLDRIVKLGKYASAGVPHFWLVDPKERSIEELILTGGRYVRGAHAGSEGAFTPSFPSGFSLESRELWAPGF
jgi:Uma2 family endonuclease